MDNKISVTQRMAKAIVKGHEQMLKDCAEFLPGRRIKKGERIFKFKSKKSLK